MDVTIQQLRYFVTVAEQLHFTRAAEQLRIAASSLSQQIATLERRAGCRLFRRTSRSVELTSAGAELLPLARRALASVDEVGAWATAQRGAEPPVRVGLVIGNQISSAILSSAALRLPELRWDVRRVGFADSLDALRTGRVDVVLMPAVTPPSDTGVHAVPIWSEERVLVVSSAHPLARRHSIDIDETNDEHFVGSGEGKSVLAEWFVLPRPSGSTPRIDPSASNFEEALDLCSAGLGVNIAGSTAAACHARPDLAYVPIRGVSDATVYLLRYSQASAPVRGFERIAVDVARHEAARYGGHRPAERGTTGG